MLRFNEDLIGDLEIWRQVTTSVGGDGVSALCLGDGRSEVLMEVIKINSKLMGTIGGKITFRVNVYVRMVAFIQTPTQLSKVLWLMCMPVCGTANSENADIIWVNFVSLITC